MTDDVGDLKAALRAAPPADPAARAEALRLALENFDRLQGSADPARLMTDRPMEGRGVLSGAFQMLKKLASRPVLAATTSAAALVAGMVIVLPLIDLGAVPGTAPKPVAVETTNESRQRIEEVPAEAEQLASPPVLVAPAPMAKAAPEGGAMTRMAAPEADAMLADAPMMEMAMEPVAAADPDMAAPPKENTEAFANAPTNPVKVTAEEPVSTFSIDVDTASYAMVRQSLNAGFLPDPASVRVEEMVNRFPYSYPAPAADEAFRPTVTVMPTPWNPGTRLVHIAIQGALPEVKARPPLNLVFLIDTSGSMDDPMKLPLLKQSLALVLPELRPEDQVAIVSYAGSAGQVLPPTPARDRAAILDALDRLAAGGSTAGAEGIALAYQVAQGMTAEGEVSRVLLATDGDFNVGMADPEALKGFIAREREAGIYLSVLGFGRGNLDDATMQALAQNGNGMAAYIDSLSEARKVLVDQLTGALFPIADNVKIQVEWNPVAVAEYRLIGYETRALRREDFNNDKVDAGDIGAGAQVTAIYEITAPGSPALLNDPLRYGAATPPTPGAELGFLRLRHVAPGETESRLQETPILPEMSAPGDEARFAVAMAGFGQLLTGATYLGGWGWSEAIALAQGARGEDAFGYRAEALGLMRLAEALDR
ncbi:vWA domain-containing protein [Tabrizicola oligotrophica]|uniref:VWA domain-containing protein n=1 Tax=Tabrizicola oligotrophica TaxID=2710650 RepID=A0A6M0QSG8_9RHOB|nr:VWA domain-containing protein [Tabrizicola oligotrophica]NEY89931.1 VWA domain-containing protein [Tabrizicola oligotrophica]